MNKVFTFINFFLSLIRKKEDVSLKVSEKWKIVRDVDLLEINPFSVKIHIPEVSPNLASLSGILKYLVGEYHVGLKSLYYLFTNQNLIPEECKDKTTLFLGTIWVDESNRLWTPSLYYLPFHNEWRMSFFCLSVDRVSSKTEIILLADCMKN